MKIASVLRNMAWDATISQCPEQSSIEPFAIRCNFIARRKLNRMPRYLTKSRFILGNSCPTKLFYTNKPRYPNANHEDDFLKSLAEGGIVVGELAKQYFQNGQAVRSLEYTAAIHETNELLQRDSVVIFEAAVAFRNLFC